MIDSVFRVFSAPSLRDAWYSSKFGFLFSMAMLTCFAASIVGVIYRIT